MQVTHDELVMILNQKFPDAVSNRDYFVAMPVDGATGAQTGDAFIVEWHLPDAQPTEDVLKEWIAENEVFIYSMRALDERMETYRPISARQLWLMARQVGITKAQVLATLEPAEGDTDDVLEKKEVLYIELTEPPLAGFLRDSPAAEDFREYMGLPPEQFDDLWRMAQEI